MPADRSPARRSAVDVLEPADLERLAEVLDRLLVSAVRNLRAAGHDVQAIARGEVPIPPSPYRAPAPRRPRRREAAS